jgi:hypothetical protein
VVKTPSHTVRAAGWPLTTCSPPIRGKTPNAQRKMTDAILTGIRITWMISDGRRIPLRERGLHVVSRLSPDCT